MKYYKMIDDKQFIGVVTSKNFKRYNSVSQLLLSSNEIEGEYVRYDMKLYRDYWMHPTTTDKFTFYNVKIIEINQEEYDELNDIIEEDQPIPAEYIEEDPIDLVVIFPDEDEITTLDFARAQKNATLSKLCRAAIENGFDMNLRGASHHFSLTTQDQFNLMSLNELAKTETLIPYHADGESCVFYTNKEINQIMESATAHKIYHTTYYNALKDYVNSLSNLADIAAVTYGMEIPNEYKTEVLKILEQ